jgi:FkbM family methyltransferase
MNLDEMKYRTYFAARFAVRKLKIAGALRRIPGFEPRVRRVIDVLLPQAPVWVRVRSGIARGMWMRLNLKKDGRLWRGEHETVVQGALLAAVVPGAVIYDIGAHAGSIALGAAGLVGPSGRVVAFEADPQNVANLHENRDRNHLTASLQIVSCAVWSYSAPAISFRRGGTKTSHGGVEKDQQCPVLGSGDLINISAVALDDFIANGGPVPQLVKIDVEGGEYEVLRGGDKLFSTELSTQRPLIVAEVHHKRAADEIVPWLIARQYSARWISPSEGFPCCVFAWPETYQGSAWMWTSGSDAPSVGG